MISCNKDTIRGEGEIKTENRTLQVASGFESIKINGSTNTEIIYGDTYKLEVYGHTNLLQVMHTGILNNTLVIEFPNHYNIKNNNTKVILTIPYLPNLDINGSANADIRGIFPAQESINISINGSGNVKAEETNMNVNFAKYQINGSGKINTINLISKTCETSISGSGEISTSVFNNLKAKISGSGKIYYQGSPSVSSEISGSGKVVKIN